MAANKRSPFQREQDLAEIARLYLQGKTQAEIAGLLAEMRDYSLSKQQINCDLKEVRKRWQESSIRDMDERKAEELARIDRLEREHWEAWEAAQEVGSQTRPGEDQPFAWRYLDGIQKCIQTRAKILGIIAPTKIGIGQDPDAPPLEINATDELISRLAGIASRVGTAGDTPEPDTE